MYPRSTKESLREGIDYQFRIGIADAGDTGSDFIYTSPCDARVLSSSMKQMVPPTLKESDETSITLKWDPVKGAEGYRIRYRTIMSLWTEIGSIIRTAVVKKKNLYMLQYCFAVKPVFADSSLSSQYEYSCSSAPMMPSMGALANDRESYQKLYQKACDVFTGQSKKQFDEQQRLGQSDWTANKRILASCGTDTGYVTSQPEPVTI